MVRYECIDFLLLIVHDAYAVWTLPTNSDDDDDNTPFQGYIHTDNTRFGGLIYGYILQLGGIYPGYIPHMEDVSWIYSSSRFEEGYILCGRYILDATLLWRMHT